MGRGFLFDLIKSALKLGDGDGCTALALSVYS